jgi:hypothetical protein
VLAEARVLALDLWGALDHRSTSSAVIIPADSASVFVEHEQAGYDGP